MTKTCTKCNGEFEWKMPYDGTKLPTGSNPCQCSAKKTAKTTGNTEPMKSGVTNDAVPQYGDFIKIVKDLYIRLFYEAGALCGEGATVKDKHITTMGLIHDYFSYTK